MSRLYEDPDYIDALADADIAEALEKERERAELINLANNIIDGIQDRNTQLALKTILILLDR